MDIVSSFQAQGLLQSTLGTHPADMEDPEEKIQYIKDMVLAVQSELQEFLNEVGWKPWATSRHINVEAAKSELVDTFQFFMNLCLAIGLNPLELLVLHQMKLQKNYARIVEGYDGVSTKCRWCGRALDDSAVSCEAPGSPGYISNDTGYCAQKAKDTGDGFFTTKDLERKK